MLKPRKLYLLFCLITAPIITALAQDSLTVIDGTSINTDLLGALFLKKLNALREQHGLNTLGTDPFLIDAANDQAAYMNQTGKVGHEQTTKGKEWPVDRVAYYKGTNDRVGENCIQINLHVPYKDKTGKTIIVNTYGDAAEALFEGWKHSPPHYRNMITPYYDMQGIGFSYNAKTQQLYSSDVFGTKRFIPPRNFEIRSDAWGVGYTSKYFPGFFSKDLANFITTDGDSIFLYYSDLKYFREYIRNKTDGIAIDIVASEQFTCNHNNNLHGSRVFDGWMLKPVYYEQLMKGNQYPKKSNELYTYVGTIPKVLLNRNIQLNTILIRKNCFAGYSYPVFVDNANLRMLHLTTYWDTIKGAISPDTFNVKINHYIEFKRNSYTLTEEQIKKLNERVHQYRKYIKRVEIHTYSSVEGSEAINIRLQNERAESIKKALLHAGASKKITMQTEAKENWAEFYKQIEGTRYEYLKNYGQNVIKLMLYNSVLLDSLDTFLSQERTAVVSFYVSGKYDNAMDPGTARIALQNAIKQNDSLKAWRIQSNMIRDYEKGKISVDDIIDNDIPVTRKFLPLLANIVAAKAIDKRYMFDPRFGQYVKQVFGVGKSYAPLKLSYCVCAINYLSTTIDTLISNPKLLKMLDDCSKDYRYNHNIGHYYLDYYIAAAYYYWFNHQFGQMDTALEGIKTYYPKTVLADTDYIKLGLLFNMYYRSRWTIDMLYPVVKKGTTNENLLFLFVTTAPMFLDEIPKDEYIKYLKQARSMDHDRFCRWINSSSWQLLREDFIKQLFCEECNRKYGAR